MEQVYPAEARDQRASGGFDVGHRGVLSWGSLVLLLVADD